MSSTASICSGVWAALTLERSSDLFSGVSAAHTTEQIDAVLAIFEELGVEYGLLQRARRASA